VSSVDRKLGDYLHEAKADKPFTLSPLQVISRQHSGVRGQGHTLQWEHTKAIAAGTSCWWRISLLDDTLFSKLTQLWLNLNPNQPWHLGPADLHITSILGTPQSTQSWANAISYAQLYEESSDHNRQIELVFCTPTAFRQSQHDCALPTRELVFNSLIKRWNQYSNIELSKTILDSIFPSFFNIRTELVADSRSKFIGCVGAMSFRLLGEVEPLTIKQVNALANFALYSGVGRKTTMGMGMVRRLNH
jgi:CRISPR-associated endoribonuclease Cas6